MRRFPLNNRWNLSRRVDGGRVRDKDSHDRVGYVRHNHRLFCQHHLWRPRSAPSRMGRLAQAVSTPKTAARSAWNASSRGFAIVAGESYTDIDIPLESGVWRLTPERRIFVPSNRNTLLDVLLARTTSRDSPRTAAASANAARRRSLSSSPLRRPSHTPRETPSTPRGRSSDVHADSDASVASMCITNEIASSDDL